MPTLKQFDHTLLKLAKRYALPTARMSLCVIFFWFGLLKVLRISPAAQLVTQLQHQTLPFFNDEFFLIVFGAIEIAIGISFLFPHITRFAIALLLLHMGATFLPLVLLPNVAWSGWFIPTLEAQYIIKNLVILALALQIGIHLKPLKK